MKTIALALSLLILQGFAFKSDLVTENTCLNEEEMKLYNLIMEYRKSKGLASIPLSVKLTQVAQAHVHDLNENFDFSQTDTCNPHSWSGKGSWTSCCYTSDHKAAKCMWDKPREISGYTGNGFEIAYYSSSGANAQEGIDGWKLSSGHNPLLINSGIWSAVTWKAIGIAIYGEYGLVWFGEVEDPDKPKVCQ